MQLRAAQLSPVGNVWATALEYFVTSVNRVGGKAATPIPYGVIDFSLT